MELIGILAMALLTVPLIGVLAGVIVLVLNKVRIVQKRFSMIALVTSLMIMPPIIWFLHGQAQAAECRALYGPDERSCGGELGGVIILFFQIYLLVGGLIVGPSIGARLHKYLSKPAP